MIHVVACIFITWYVSYMYSIQCLQALHNQPVLKHFLNPTFHKRAAFCHVIQNDSPLRIQRVTLDGLRCHRLQTVRIEDGSARWSLTKQATVWTRQSIYGQMLLPSLFDMYREGSSPVLRVTLVFTADNEISSISYTIFACRPISWSVILDFKHTSDKQDTELLKELAQPWTAVATYKQVNCLPANCQESLLNSASYFVTKNIVTMISLYLHKAWITCLVHVCTCRSAFCEVALDTASPYTAGIRHITLEHGFTKNAYLIS